MKKFVQNNARTATVTLDGGECEVIFGSRYNVFSVQSESDVTVALESCRTAGDDGVMVCKGGESIMYPHMMRLDRVYITGSGKVNVFASNEAVNPFRKRAKGGDDNYSGDVMPHMDDITDYFDISSLDVNNGQWVNRAGGNNIILTDFLIDENDKSVTFGNKGYGEIETALPYCMYIVFKTTQSPTDWGEPILFKHSTNVDAKSGFGLGGSAEGTVWFAENNYSNGNLNTYSLNNYNLICISTLGNFPTVYVNGICNQFSYNSSYAGSYGGHMEINRCRRGSYIMIGDANLCVRFIAFGSKYHDNKKVYENSQYLIKKYEVEI